jgi:alkylated DNA repair dioxygenase AlkB
MDLFGPPLPGLAAMPDLVDEAEAAALIDWAATVPVEPFRFQGWTGKRLTHSFGWRYDFDDHSFGPVAPIPDILMPVRARAAAFAGLSADDLVQAMVTRYDPGAGIGWHRDRPVFEHVVGLSLGAAATMRFRRRVATKFERATLPLAPRAAYHLAGDARHLWEHSIAEMAETRWSITFRSLSERGRRALP